MTAAAAGLKSQSLTQWRFGALLVISGLAVALTELRIPSIVGVPVPVADIARLLLGLVGFIFALDAASQFPRLPWRRPWVVILIAFIGCVAAGWLGGVSWPNSGDEYSYVFLADTFRAGRLWDPPPPDPLLFKAFHVLVKDGRTFCPYPPAWSALLVPFRVLRSLWLVNPLLTATLGAILVAIYRRLGLRAEMQVPALTLVLLTPFTLFLGGSLFPQTMAAVLVAAIVWAQLADEPKPRFWRKLATGALFGLLLLSRCDVFAIVAVPYAIDRLVQRRFAGVMDGLAVMLGLLPFALGFLAYNAAITGDPLQLPATWVASNQHDPAMAGLVRMLLPVQLNLYWLGNLAEFGGLAVLILASIALRAKILRRSSRFYDFLLPAAILFYSFVPFSGGHQYGPRYWFWAWPLGTLTIATGLADALGYVRAFGRRVSLEGLAAAMLLTVAASFCVLLVAAHGYIAARRAVFDPAPPSKRAVVLVPDRQLHRWWWPEIPAPALDFTRNDIDYSGKVLYALGNVPDAAERACRLSGRAVFRWEEPGRLARVACP